MIFSHENADAVTRPLLTAGATCVFGVADLLEPHCQRIEGEEPAYEEVTLANEQFDCFGRLKKSDDPWEHAQDPGLASVRRQVGRWLFGEEAAITGTLSREEGGDLALETKDAAMDKRSTSIDRDFVQKIFRGKIIGAIEQDIRGLRFHEMLDRVGGNPRRENIHRDIGVDGAERFPGGFNLRDPDGLLPMENLTLQIGARHPLVVSDAHCADSGRREVRRRCGAEPACSDQ